MTKLQQPDGKHMPNAGGAVSTTYRPKYVPATQDIRETFDDEIAALGGDVCDVYEDGDRLFARAVLPVDTEVRPGDRVRAGVAVRASGPDIMVHPYTFRQVCTNGAIAAHALETRRLERTYSTEVFVSGYDLAVALTELRLAVRACAAKEAFEVVAGEMRTAAEVEADLALHLGPALASLPRSMTAQWLPMIFRSFEESGDRSAFGLLNAVTAVARDISDPEVQWTLEQLGGTTPARLSLSPKAREVLVGA